MAPGVSSQRCTFCTRHQSQCVDRHCPRCGLLTGGVVCSICQLELSGAWLPIPDKEFVLRMADGLEMVVRHRASSEKAMATMRGRTGQSLP